MLRAHTYLRRLSHAVKIGLAHALQAELVHVREAYRKDDSNGLFVVGDLDAKTMRQALLYAAKEGEARVLVASEAATQLLAAKPGSQHLLGQRIEPSLPVVASRDMSEYGSIPLQEALKLTGAGAVTTAAAPSLSVPVLPGAGSTAAAEGLVLQQHAKQPRAAVTDMAHAIAAQEEAQSWAAVTAQQLLWAACTAGDAQSLLRLLGDTSSATEDADADVSSAADAATPATRRLRLTRAMLCAHHPDHGATPLHLLVTAPAWLDVDAAVAAGQGLEEQPLVRAVRRMVHVGGGGLVSAVAGNAATPLHWAAGAGHAAAVTVLLQLGADPDAKTYTWRRQVFGRGSGQLPLHWAAESNHAAVVALLSRASPASLVAADERARTAKDVAQGELALEAMAALAQAEAKSYVCIKLTLQGALHGIVEPAQSQPLPSQASIDTTTTTTTTASALPSHQTDAQSTHRSHAFAAPLMQLAAVTAAPSAAPVPVFR